MTAQRPPRDDLDELWRATKNGDIKARDTLVEEYTWLAHTLVHRQKIPSHIDRDDLLSWAYRGLFEAVQRFDVDKSDGSYHKQFVAFARLRVGGAILDGLKSPSVSWASRTAWGRLRAQREAEDALTQELLRHPTREEICERMGETPESFSYLRQQIPLGSIGEVDEVLEFPALDRPDEEAGVDAIAQRLAEVVVTIGRPARSLLADLYLRNESVNDAARHRDMTPTTLRKARDRALRELHGALQAV